MEGITHDPIKQCFSSPNGAILSYTVEDGRYILDHTEVPPALRGQGVAAELARTALDHARQHQWKIVPACSYIERFVQRHPEYKDLL